MKKDDLAWPSHQFWGLFGVLAALFLMGGSSRSDVQSLPFLNAAMILSCGVAAFTLKQEQWRENKWLLASIGLLFALIALYLIPLPVQIEEFRRGASNAAEVYAMTNTPGPLQSLALAPAVGLQSLFSMFAPLAVLLFAVQLSRNDLKLTLPLLIAIAMISGILGVVQLLGSANGPMYFYRITNNGSAVGLFANRNHAAVFLACLFPMLAIFAKRSRTTSRDGKSTPELVAMATAVILVPLILVTGSRSGMLAAMLGLMGGITLYFSKTSHGRSMVKGKSSALILVAVILLGLVFTTIYFSRAEAIERVFADSAFVNDRSDFWWSSSHLFWQYFPVGFGPGSFVFAYQYDEPSALLNRQYLNTMHNDWLETGLAYGIPGILLLLAGTIYYLWQTFILWFRRDGACLPTMFGRLASVIIAIVGIASISDYPLRTPAMMGFAALVVFWFVQARHQPRDMVNRQD